MGFTAYVRYKQVEHFFKARTSSKDNVSKYNKIGLIFGMIAAVGSSVVGNFQESNILSVHVIGAFMAFGGGAIFLIFQVGWKTIKYLWERFCDLIAEINNKLQAYFSFKMVPLFGTKALATFRMVIGVTCLTLFIISYSTGVISFSKFTGKDKLFV